MKQVLKGNIICAGEIGELDVFEKGYLILEDGVVTNVCTNLDEGFDYDVMIDYKDCLIMQSFADMHLHAPQYPMVGLGMDLPLLDWLNTYTFNVEAEFADKEYARKVYSRLAKDLIKNGTTRVCAFSSLHTEATWILMDEFEKNGLTGFVGKVNMDRNGKPGVLEEETQESIDETIRWLKGCSFEHIKPIITPRFTPSCTDRLMDELGKISQEYGLYVQSHLSENTSEIELVLSLNPGTRNYYESYQKHGLWKDHTVMAHCVHCDERELKAIKDANVYVAHCPNSNVNICSGICPVKKLLDKGINVVLGSDIAGGDQLAIYKVLTTAIQTSKNYRITDDWKTDFLSVEEAYYLATTAGHKYFGANSGLSVGDKLHAIVVDDSTLPPIKAGASLKERFERALYSMDDRNIVSVWSDGRNVLHN